MARKVSAHQRAFGKRAKRAWHKCKPLLGYQLIGKRVPSPVIKRIGTNSYRACLVNETGYARRRSRRR